MTRKESIIQGALILVVVQAFMIVDIYRDARAQNWHRFWVDLVLLMALAMISGFVIVDTINHRRRLKRARTPGPGP